MLPISDVYRIKIPVNVFVQRDLLIVLQCFFYCCIQRDKHQQTFLAQI